MNSLSPFCYLESGNTESLSHFPKVVLLYGAGNASQSTPSQGGTSVSPPSGSYKNRVRSWEGMGCSGGCFLALRGSWVKGGWEVRVVAWSSLDKSGGWLNWNRSLCEGIMRNKDLQGKWIWINTFFPRRVCGLRAFSESTECFQIKAFILWWNCNYLKATWWRLSLGCVI